MNSRNPGARRVWRSPSIWLLLLCSTLLASEAPAKSDASTHAASANLDGLIQEALARSPMITSAQKHWQAQTKVPVQVSTLPDPLLGLQQLTVGSPQPFSGYETSDF